MPGPTGTSWVDNRGLESIESLYQIRRGQYDRVIVSSASVAREGRYDVLRAVLRFGRRDDGFRDGSEEREYSGLRLERAVLSLDDGWKVLRGLVEGNGTIGRWAENQIRFTAAYTGRPQGQNYPTPFPRRARNQWPSYDFFFKPEPNPVVGDVGGPLVARSLPPLLNPRMMVDEWLDADPQIVLGSSNYIQVILPDFRARITHLKLAEEGVHASVGRSRDVTSELSYQAAISWENVDQETSTEEEEGGCLVRATGPWNQFAFFVLSHPTFEIIDWAQLYPTVAYQPELVSWAVPEKQLDQLIEEWESQTVEFKESANAAADFIESVVAFANSNDGAIIVGVSDSGEVVGVGNPVKEEDRLRNMISDWCDPPVNPTFNTLPYAGKSVLVVSVSKGTNGPYLSRYTGAIYLRRGGHDVPAKTRALVDSLYPRG